MMKLNENEMNFSVPLEIIKASEIEPKEVKWLWYPYIPFGKVTLLQGDPGDGKSKLKQLEAEAITLRQEIEVQERQNENIEKFIQRAHKYVGIEELDGYALRELVSGIYVDAPDKSSGKRVQHIHIKYDGLGFIPLEELMKRETA